MSVRLPDLPYSSDALEPMMSSGTLEIHHGKHHRAYVDKLNELIKDTPYESMPLIDIVARSHNAYDTLVFDNAAQCLNHEYFWKSLSPGGGGDPQGPLKEAIARQFGSLDSFRQAFREAAVTHFGSGWAWLAADGARLRILTTSNADTPVLRGVRPLLTLDLWEHAYYLDYQNQRGQYVDNYLEKLVDWSYAASNFDAIRAAA